MAVITATFPTDWVAPQRGEAAEAFSTKANIAWAKLRDPLVPNLNLFGTQANEVRDEVNSFKTQTETLKNTATTQANKATTEATKASLAAVSATQMRNETAGLIELLPSDVNLAYTKAAIDAKLNDRDLANFLDFKF